MRGFILCFLFGALVNIVFAADSTEVDGSAKFTPQHLEATATHTMVENEHYMANNVDYCRAQPDLSRCPAPGVQPTRQQERECPDVCIVHRDVRKNAVTGKIYYTKDAVCPRGYVAEGVYNAEEEIAPNLVPTDFTTPANILCARIKMQWVP